MNAKVVSFDLMSSGFLIPRTKVFLFMQSGPFG